MSHTHTLQSVSFSLTNSEIRAVPHPLILLLTPVYVSQQYFWGLTADCLILVTVNLFIPCLYCRLISECLIFVMQQQECSPLPTWNFTIFHFLWAVLNLQPFELILCGRKQPSSFQHLQGYVIISYWKFLEHSSALLDLYSFICRMSIVRHLSFCGIDCIRWQ